MLSLIEYLPFSQDCRNVSPIWQPLGCQPFRVGIQRSRDNRIPCIKRKTIFCISTDDARIIANLRSDVYGIRLRIFSRRGMGRVVVCTLHFLHPWSFRWRVTVAVYVEFTSDYFFFLVVFHFNTGQYPRLLRHFRKLARSLCSWNCDCWILLFALRSPDCHDKKQT